jgi:hypothetical protein
MAHKQHIPKYYAYFDKPTGKILAVTNEKSQHHKSKIDISYNTYAKLVSGDESFNDYTIGYLKSISGKTTVELVPKTNQAFIFKNTMFELISSLPNEDTELTVEWNGTRSEWAFSVSAACVSRLCNNNIPSKLIFFVILADDYDLLIRTIFIDTVKLMSSRRICTAFASPIESQIDKISLATKLTFESYGLTVNE